MKTAFNATRLAIAAFIVPYIFAFEPVLLFENISQIAGADPFLNDMLAFFEITLICVTALFGIFGIAASLNGYLFRPANLIMRALLLIGGLLMLVPGFISDLTGLALLGAAFVIQYKDREK